jgi:hypothetical protein
VKLNLSEIVGQMMFSTLSGAVMHFVLCSQMMAKVHGQKILSVVNYCSYAEGSLTCSHGKGVLQTGSVCIG